MKKEISFSCWDFGPSDPFVAGGLLKIEVPQRMEDVHEIVNKSFDGKVLPSYEGSVEIPVILPDGTAAVLSGRIALWFDKATTRHVFDEKEKLLKLQRLEEERERLKSLSQEELLELLLKQKGLK